MTGTDIKTALAVLDIVIDDDKLLKYLQRADKELKEFVYGRVPCYNQTIAIPTLLQDSNGHKYFNLSNVESVLDISEFNQGKIVAKYLPLPMRESDATTDDDNYYTISTGSPATIIFVGRQPVLEVQVRYQTTKTPITTLSNSLFYEDEAYYIDFVRAMIENYCKKMVDVDAYNTYSQMANDSKEIIKTELRRKTRRNCDMGIVGRRFTLTH